LLQKQPKLIPIVGHRFLPAEPCEAGNPVLSVWQMVDTIYYGCDLKDFIAREANYERIRKPLGDVRPIRFWGQVVEGWYQNPAEPGAAPAPTA
jgi:hypothetical protein